MLKLYNILRRHQLTGKPIQIINNQGRYHFKHCPRYTLDPTSINTGRLLVDCGITIGLKDTALASLECTHGSEMDLCPKCKRDYKEEDYTIFFPELNKDDVINLPVTVTADPNDPQKTIVEYAQLTDVVFVHPSLQISMTRAQSNDFYLITDVRIVDLSVSQIKGPNELVEFCELYTKTIVSPEPVNLQMYLGTPRTSRACVIGGTNNILGSSGAGKSRFISELLAFSQIQGGEKLTPMEQNWFKSNISDIRNVLIVADEPSLHISLWYATADTNYIIYGLTQKKLQTMLRYLVAKYNHDMKDEKDRSKYKLLNVYVDSITELIYAPSKTKQEGEFVSSTTFVKGISASVKPEMLTVSRSSGIIPETNIILTLITTANIPGTGAIEDETAFWNIVSGNSPNSIWIYKHNVRMQRDRTKEQGLFDSSVSDITSMMSDNDNNDMTQGFDRDHCSTQFPDSISTNFNINETYRKVRR